MYITAFGIIITLLLIWGAYLAGKEEGRKEAEDKMESNRRPYKEREVDDEFDDLEV